MAIPPQITPMPPAPVRTQAGPTYAAVADTFAAALVQLAVQINIVVAYINGIAIDASTTIEASATAVAAKDAAAAYAAAAKASATAAENAQGSIGNLALMYAIALAS